MHRYLAINLHNTQICMYIYIYLAESWILHRWSRSGLVLNSYRIRLSPLERFSIPGNLIIINLIIGVDISGQANYEIKWRQITYYIDLVREVIDSYAIINYIGRIVVVSCVLRIFRSDYFPRWLCVIFKFMQFRILDSICCCRINNSVCE